MSATENDFLLGEAANASTLGDPKNFSKLAMRLCHRHRGLGADGLLLLSPKPDPGTWAWDFYNSDGSRAEMCGNAARCAGLWAKRKMPSESVFNFLTLAGPVRAQVVSASKVEVTMPPVTAEPQALAEVLGVKFVLINSGVPHAVTAVQAAPRPEDLLTLAREVRHHPNWGAPGANVTFVYSEAPGKVMSLTFERGVENFTRSCGTGAVAAAFLHAASHPGTERVSVRVLGGDLEVRLQGKTPTLTGAACFIGEFKLDPSFIRELSS